MKVSINTVKQFTNINTSIDELVEKINTQLGTIEAITDLGEKYKDVIIVKIMSAEQHPNADRLKVTKVDDGGVVLDVPRDESGYVQVVCGAPNAREGIWAAWLPPKSMVPKSFDDKDPFILDARELRGELSQGMLAAADELAIGTDHDGILEIDADEWRPNDSEIKPGASFAKVFSLDDTIIDIENKMFTHRPDLFGQLGVAREIAGIHQQKFESPQWYWQQPEFERADGLNLTIFNDTTDKAPRFMAVAMKDVEIKPSPLWLQCALVAMGSKPINNIVDVTNYVMLLTAQPTHAYDYDKLRGHTLGTRMARKDESITLLNHKTYKLDESDIVIVDGEGPVGLAGIMGGGDSEVSVETKNIVLEVANFDMYAVRKSSMRHGVFTDAWARFNKGQSPLQNNRILNLLMMSVIDVSPNAKQASDVNDIHSDKIERTMQDQSSSNELKVEASFINERLGLSLPEPDIQQLLRNVEFACFIDQGDTATSFTAPFFRTDIELPEDIVEEVGRLYGFDKLPRVLPQRSIRATQQNPLLQQKRRIREALSKAGANEVLTYSFTHEKTMQKAGQDSQHAYKLSNALSPDLQYYRLSLTPSLLDKINQNVRAGYAEFALFEIGKTHFKGEMDQVETTLPNEDSHIAFVITDNARRDENGAAYYRARRYAEQITDLSAYDLVPLIDFKTKDDPWSQQLVAPYEPKRSAVIVKDEEVYGIIGEFRQSVTRNFKLPHYTAGFELHLDAVVSPKRVYRALSRYPNVSQDLSIEVDQQLGASNVLSQAQTILTTLGEAWVSDVAVISIYQAEGSTKKTISLRIVVSHRERSLTDAEVGAILLDIQANVLAQ